MLFDVGVVAFMFVTTSLYAWRWKDLSYTARISVPLLTFVSLGIISALGYVFGPPGGWHRHTTIQELHSSCVQACAPDTQETCKAECLCLRTKLHESRTFHKVLDSERAKSAEVDRALSACQR